jgi:hypothetical protein
LFSQFCCLKINSKIVKPKIMVLIGREKSDADGLQPAIEIVVNEREREN